MLEHTEIRVRDDQNCATQPLRIKPIPFRTAKKVHRNDSITFAIDTKRLARRVFAFCILAEVAFVALDYHVNYGQLVDLASGFASTQIFLAGLTLLCIYLLVRKKPQSKWRALGWLVLSCFFIYMAIAGNVLLHERPGAASRAMGRLVFLPAYLGLGLLTLGFLWREMATTSSRLLLLFAIPCFALAVGIDYAEGLNPDHPWNPYTFLAGRTNLNIWVVAGQLSKSIEESLEMLGYSILWFLFIGHLGTITNDLQVQFRS